MSTNYYWKHDVPTTIKLDIGPEMEWSQGDIDMDPFIHIGKRSSKGKGVCCFTWAQLPNRVQNFCHQFPDYPVIVNEYKEEFTGKQFLDVLSGCEEWNEELIGEWFC